MAPALQPVERERIRRIVIEALDRISARKPRQKVLERALLLARLEDLPDTLEGWVDFARGPLDEATRVILGNPAAGILAETVSSAFADHGVHTLPPPSSSIEGTPSKRPVSGARRLDSNRSPESGGPRRVVRPRQKRLNTLSYSQGGLDMGIDTDRILVVDDDPTYRSALARLLISRGYEVSTAPDRKTALWMCERLEPRLVLTDYELGDGGTGLDLAEALEAKLGSSAPPVLVVTASTALPKTSAPLVVGVLAKDSTDELVAAIAEIIGQPDDA